MGGLLLLGLLVVVISVNSVVTSGSYMIYVCVLICGFDVWLLCSWYDLLSLVVLFGFLVTVYLLVEFVWFVIVFVCYGGSDDLVCGLLVAVLCVLWLRRFLGMLVDLFDCFGVGFDCWCVWFVCLYWRVVVRLVLV